jgi:hypothetical protein
MSDQTQATVSTQGEIAAAATLSAADREVLGRPASHAEAL